MGHMTRKEMLERLEAGESPAAISLDKWKRLIPPGGERFHWLWFYRYCGIDECALCEVFECEDCPLDMNNDGCGSDRHPWRRCWIAADDRSRPDFMTGRAALIKRLKRIVEREQSR